MIVKDLGVGWWGQMDFIPSTWVQSFVETSFGLDVWCGFLRELFLALMTNSPLPS